jgi:ABC-type Zn2+ transport system substrate-binding protein/surface adhesin
VTSTIKRQCGREPPEPAQVELAQPEPAGPLALGDQHQRDHEARDHEEHVDPDEPAGHRHPRVERDHHQDGDRAQALDVEPPPRAGWGQSFHAHKVP